MIDGPLLFPFSLRMLTINNHTSANDLSLIIVMLNSNFTIRMLDCQNKLYCHMGSGDGNA